jgi:3-oxoacyl-[acyl-carrier protein] reductase
LIKGFAEHFSGRPGTGRIVSITSDHTAGNLAYGASKGAMDRIVLAAAVELVDRGITANVVNPGATQTGWMSPDIERRVLETNLQPRLGQPDDVANLVRFLCSERGQWVNGQLLHSDGGLRP